MIRKLLMTADTVGGVWTYTLDLCRALQAFNIDVAVATMGYPLTPLQRTEANRVENIEIFESEFRLEWMTEPWQDLARAGEWLLSVRDRCRPDIVHLNGYVHGALPWHVPALIVGHSCVLSWWEAVHGSGPTEEWSRYRNAVAMGLKAATQVTAPSHAMMASLEQHYGPFSSAEVVANGRNPGLFRAANKLPIMLSAGRVWDPAKNVQALLDVAGRLPWPLYVAGENSFENRFEDVSRPGVRYLGPLSHEQLAEWMALASIFVAPARYEPFGLTVLEAAYSACALVLGDIPSLRENWDGAAVFVPPDDRARLSGALQELAADPEYRLDLGRRACERAEQFTADRMAAGYTRIYTALCGSPCSITH